MHQLAIYEDLIRTNTISDGVGGISGCGDLDLTPLLVRRDKLALGCEPLEFLVYALLFYATFALDQRRCCRMYQY